MSGVPLAPGDRVLLLRLASRTDLNGKMGRVIGPHDDGRYPVHVQGEKVRVRRESLVYVNDSADEPRPYVPTNLDASKPTWTRLQRCNWCTELCSASCQCGCVFWCSEECAQKGGANGHTLICGKSALRGDVGGAVFTYRPVPRLVCDYDLEVGSPTDVAAMSEAYAKAIGTEPFGEGMFASWCAVGPFVFFNALAAARLDGLTEVQQSQFDVGAFIDAVRAMHIARMGLGKPRSEPICAHVEIARVARRKSGGHCLVRSFMRMAITESVDEEEEEARLQLSSLSGVQLVHLDGAAPRLRLTLPLKAGPQIPLSDLEGRTPFRPGTLKPEALGWTLGSVKDGSSDESDGGD